ncbi:lipopolysaccharide biosynthesis protein [Peribacillus simplex]|uniref:lipopolysaccharide biosynthesis protein n=1 Tax=Peribacillus simplex TaxID=1478 RepID=UPI003671DC05
MKGSTSLKKKTLSGFFWSFTDLFANQGIQFVIQIILARLLLPEHFGVIGMILVFIAISNSIIDSGFSQALIREKDANQVDYSTVFYFNLIMAFVMYGVLYISAPSISGFFGEPQLVLILRVLSLVLIIDSFGIIQRVTLIKNVDFRTQMKINIISGTTSGIIAIIFALMDYGVWSLVIKTLSMQFFQSLLLWLFNKWVPSVTFSVQSLKRFFGFGSKLMVSGLIDTVYNNIYFVIIGKFFSASQLGYYTNAVKLRDVVSQSITSSFQRVTYPVLSSIKEDEKRLKSGFRKVVKISSFIIFPVMLGLVAIASPLINLLLGDKWMPSVKYFQLLCLAGMLYPLHSINLNILLVKGRSDLFLLLEIIKKVILTILIVLSLWFKVGIMGLIIVAVLHSYLALFVNTYFSSKEISYSMREQIKDILPIFLIALFMGIVVFYIGAILPSSNIIKIVIQISSGCIVYVSISILAKINEFNTVYKMVRPFLKKLKRAS